jgi:hypothetical protein
MAVPHSHQRDRSRIRRRTSVCRRHRRASCSARMGRKAHGPCGRHDAPPRCWRFAGKIHASGGPAIFPEITTKRGGSEVRHAPCKIANAGPPADILSLSSTVVDSDGCEIGELRVFPGGRSLAPLRRWHEYLAIARTLPHPAGTAAARRRRRTAAGRPTRRWARPSSIPIDATPEYPAAMPRQRMGLPQARRATRSAETIGLARPEPDAWSTPSAHSISHGARIITSQIGEAVTAATPGRGINSCRWLRRYAPPQSGADDPPILRCNRTRGRRGGV